MKTLAEILDYFDEDEDSAYCEFVPETSLAEAEYHLKIKLPPSYKQFLLAAGSGDGRVGRIMGIGPEGYRDSKLGEDVELMKEWSKLTSEGKLIPFADDFSGNFYCFDYRKDDPNKEYPVVFWDRMFKFEQEPQPVANNFLEFMSRSIEDSED